MSTPRHCRKLRFLSACVATAALCPVADASAQGFLDTWTDKLFYTSADGSVQADLSVNADLTVFAAKQPPQGLLITDDDVFVAPGLSAFLDVAIGERALVHGQLRADRGFDPGAEPDGQVRLDELFLQIRTAQADRLNLRAGKYATVFGSWAPRHLPWDNPLITAPNPYEDLLPITNGAAPPNVPSFAARRDAPANKDGWVPIIWGPSYAIGAAALGRLNVFEYAVEVKNAALSSPPETWDDLGNGSPPGPTVSARLGLLPAPEWTLGASFSRGPYLRESAQASLPVGADSNDFDQTTWGVDLAYAHHRWQVWSELIYATFDVPNVGHVDVLSGYIETKYKITPRLWTALRVNHAWFGAIPGTALSWDRDTTGLDVGLGYRYSTHLEAKLQYSLANQQGKNTEGQHLFAAQVVLRF